MWVSSTNVVKINIQLAPVELLTIWIIEHFCFHIHVFYKASVQRFSAFSLSLDNLITVVQYRASYGLNRHTDVPVERLHLVQN